MGQIQCPQAAGECTLTRRKPRDGQLSPDNSLGTIWEHITKEQLDRDTPPRSRHRDRHHTIAGVDRRSRLPELSRSQSDEDIPYSKFPVGAALLTADDTVVVGANCENASYGGTICAERNAVTTALSKGYRKFKAIAIVSELEEPITPCGMCRQFLIEFGEYRVGGNGISEDRRSKRMLSH
ncbi:hypothetical protein Q1695_016177 [Nippostrongylus brasiliensis]|nr:hypothetical protein Q1695_016177 [Nippostrongylus brasiliensis]